MHDVSRVCFLQRERDLRGDLEGAGGGQPPLLHRVTQHLALNKVHHEEVLVVIDAEVEQVDGEGRPQQRRDLRLALETLQVRLVADEVGVQQLERDALVVAGVHGLVDDSPAALTERAAQAVVGDSLRLRQLR